jgi:filamentous hemagglutinin
MSCSNLRLSPRRRQPILRSFLYVLVCLLNFELSLTTQAGQIFVHPHAGGRGHHHGRGNADAPETGNPPAAAVQAAINPAGMLAQTAQALRSLQTMQTAAHAAAARAASAAAGAGSGGSSGTLAQTTQALQSVQAMQAAARAAAQAGANNLGADPNHPGQQLPDVPNGLATLGLVPDSGLASPGVANPVTTWQNAQTPTQSTTGGQTAVTVLQTAQQALLNWQTFNIGKQTTLTFDQTAGGANASEWIAFNKVNDPSGVPSQILGSLNAIGQVYVINSNGIIFGGSSQINTHTLVASALPINDNLIARGVLNNPDNQFLFTALPLPAGQNNGGTPSFTPPPSNTSDGHYGDVVVQEGAQITSPTNADHVGGRIALIGANVTNDGTISTPDGQAILASGLQVGFGASSDPELRGLTTYVGAVTDPSSPLAPYAGTATNLGLIEAPRADVTIAGKTVDQFGFIDSSTSVALNGRIDLLADYNATTLVYGTNPNGASAAPFNVQSSGIVTLGAGSVSQIVPEISSTDRIVGTQLALNSQMNIQGVGVHQDSGSILFAPSASLSISAGTWALLQPQGFTITQLIASGGQIYLDPGALIDVSGLQDVPASVTENIVAAQLLGPELANFPLQRDGALRGQTVYIDINKTGTYNGTTWIGSPIGDLSGYANLVQRTVGELSTNGGTVNLSAGESVVLQPGATINVSGGWTSYKGGNVRTTQVVSSGGQIYDISQATPDRVYTGIVGGFTDTHPRWGIAQTYGSPSSTYFQPGYTQGGGGGSLTITSSSTALDGTLLGNTVVGPRQVTNPAPASSLSLNVQSQIQIGNAVLPLSPTPPEITFGNGTLAAADPFALDASGNPVPLRSDRKEQVILSPDLVDTDGFGNLLVNNGDGSITVPAGVSLTTLVGGSISFLGANVDIEGNLGSPGGALTFNAYDISPYILALNGGVGLMQTPPADPTRGQFDLGSTASLDVSGMLTDLRGGSSLSAYRADGGTVSITGYGSHLAPGSAIDVSGGATISGKGSVAYGNGGTISIAAGQDSNIKSVIGGALTLDASLSGFSGSVGGTLSILAPLVQIGGTTNDTDTLLLAPEFFSQGGFTNFQITGLGEPTGQEGAYLPAFVIAAGTTITPVAESLQIAGLGPAGSTLALDPVVLLEGVRTPVSLSFAAAGVPDPFGEHGLLPTVRGDFIMNSGATIATDPLGNVSISGNTATVLGSISAPGGNITVTGGAHSENLFTDSSQALVTVDLGPQSLLSAAGTTVLVPNSLGFRTGSVLAGGNVLVSGNIAAEAGSVIDVSGTSNTLDLAPGFSNQPLSTSTANIQLVPTRIDTSGGTITFNGSQELFADALLLGAAGGPGAVGGSLSIYPGVFIPPGSNSLGARQTTLIVTQSGPTIGGPFGGVGHPISGGDLGHFAADSFNTSGLDSLTLAGTVQFSGPVSINAPGSLAVASSGVIYADAAVSLSGGYVSLGTTFRPPFAVQEPTNAFYLGSVPDYFSPTYGSGSLSISGSLIDIGNLSLQGIGSASLTAANGDVRGDGTFDITGNLSITAGQIYPTTDTSFTLAAYDDSSHGVVGTINLYASGTRPLPLSAGGQLNVYASTINDGGVLRAPIGTINIGIDSASTRPIDQITGQGVPLAQQVNLLSGSVASVSAMDPTTGKALTIPYGFNQNGTSWIDPAGNDITVGGVPSKSINVAGASVSDQAGSNIDISGGGDLSTDLFQTGTTGTIDILNTSSSFAILPGYDLGYAPYAAYNLNSGAPNIGYTNSALKLGDRIYLGASSGLPAGTYTLLPARYALLPGAFLVTPKSGTPVSPAVTQPDGSVIVSGYKLNGFDAPAVPPLFSSFEVDSSAVVQNRAQYNDYSANTFLSQSAIDHGSAAPRLPMDSGHLLFDATQSMAILGSLTSQAPTGGRGGLVDISSPLDILIAAPGVSGVPGELVLDSSALSAFGAESLLIGGIRQTTADGTAVAVTTDNITIDNAGSPLTAPDLILVANQNLNVAAGADIESSGTVAGSADSLLFGNSDTAGSGDGVVLRVSADPSAQIARTSVDSSPVPAEIIGAGARVSGASVILDSTYATSLDPSAVLSGSAVGLDSGQISIQLPNGGTPQNTVGLVLTGVALQNLQSVDALSLLSYSSIDIYGTGEIAASNSLSLHAGEIRGFNTGGTVDFVAKSLALDNSPNATAPGAIAAQNGLLQFDADTVQFGANALSVDQFDNTTFNSSSGILLQGTGSFSTQGNLTVSAPIITATVKGTQTISATGAIDLLPSATTPTQLPSSGLGSQIAFIGASVSDNANIVLPSGIVTLQATNGDLTLGDVSPTTIDVGGIAQNFFDVVKYTSGGQVNLIADNGSVNLNGNAMVNVGAQSGGGNAGTVSISAPNGTFVLAGALNGAGSAGGANGSFSLDIGTLPTLGTLDAALNADMFTESRSIRVRNGDVLVDGTATSHTFDLSADNGSIAVTGTIDASGTTGGTINLDASGSTVLQSSSLLTVAAQNFDDAGKGGAISLEAGSEINGLIDSSAMLDIQSGSTIDLSVAAQNSNSASLGDFSGKLHLRAPQLPDASDLQMAPINGTILGASAVVVEGYKLFDLTGTSGTIDSTVQSNVQANATAFIGAAGTTTNGYTAMFNRLLANNQLLAPITVIEAGAEIINRSGDLTLGSSSSTTASDWDLSTYRFGPNSEAGDLTLRASGNLVFYNALSDGFTAGTNSGASYDAVLMAQNPLLPVNEQSWSYRFTAGADFSASDFHRVQPLASLGSTTGSLLLGKNYNNNVFGTPGPSATTSSAVLTRYQVIRTGSGDIDISAGRDVQLLNQFATIYTAGTLASNPTLGGTFDTPVPDTFGQDSGLLGVQQQITPYPVQYSLAGGNLSISAQNDIIHLTQQGGVLVDDSSREIPINWLDRRGFVDPTTGLFAPVSRTGHSDVGSTTWWVDFSNFFEGVGTLGGGNVTLAAGHDVSNVDAVAATNARMPGRDSGGNPIAPNANSLVELGGGDVTVNAGNNIDGGVYYVERGQGTLAAGNDILTNSTRSTSLGNLIIPTQLLASESWLPTTLFLGKGSFDVTANGDLLLGPVANPFLLPEGVNNAFWYKTYFSTYAPTDAVNVTSLNGNVTLREAANLALGNANPLLWNWLNKISVLNTTQGQISASYYQPWLRLDESIVDPFKTLVALLPPSLSATSFSGDLNVVGNLTLFPSSTGTLDLLAQGAINGVQPSGSQAGVTDWASSQINLSDTDPSRIYSITTPFAYRSILTSPTSANNNQSVNPLFLNPISSLFSETGSTEGAAAVLQNKQALHTPGLLHANDPNPVRLYAEDGDISGFTLFAGKPGRVVAGQDLIDIALYLQNNNVNDVSLVAAGRDLIAYDPISALRVAAQSPGNILNNVTPAAGDIQIGGPGTIEVLAGRNFDLGVGPNRSDGTALGLTTIGNARNPYLPFAGANIIAGAGIGVSDGLSSSNLDFATFISNYLDPSNLAGQSARYLPELGTLLGLTNASNSDIWSAFNQLSEERQDAFALDIFYLVLRDSGRDRNDPSSPNFGNFDEGFAAIAALFPDSVMWQGDISLTSREIKTKNGGDIALFAPGGQLSVGLDISGTQPLDQGILTEHGGNISIFTKNSVNVGTSRIFTLRGGNEIIWSSYGDIAAGSSSKTVQTAPPTRVLIDPQSGDVQTDLAGLATGGGIGVLESVAGIPPADVDLIAPNGTINAGDAGIRVSGNLNLAAVQIVNAGNITVGGTSVGVPTVTAPNVGSLTTASNATAATSNAAQQLAQNNAAPPPQEQVPSIISVEVLGYGGGGDEGEGERRRKEKKKPEGSQTSAQEEIIRLSNASSATASGPGRTMR